MYFCVGLIALWRLDGSPIFVKILGHKFLVNFYATFPCKTTYIALCTERSHIVIGLLNLGANYINCNKCSSKTGLLRVHILIGKKGYSKACS